MIKEINEKDIAECVDVIRSFYTVAEESGFTTDNAPRNEQTEWQSVKALSHLFRMV